MRALIAAILLLASTVNAEESPRERAKKAYAIGQAAYERGQFRAAALSFKLAYELEPLPALLYNMAQSWRRHFELTSEREALEQAVASYDAFLEAAKAGQKVNETDRAESAKQVVILRPMIPKDETAAPVVIAPPPVPVAAQERKRRLGTAEIIGISVGGGGGLVLVLGLGLGLGLRANGPPSITPRF
jgi:hypothetical protein